MPEYMFSYTAHVHTYFLLLQNLAEKQGGNYSHFADNLPENSSLAFATLKASFN